MHRSAFIVVVAVVSLFPRRLVFFRAHPMQSLPADARFVGGQRTGKAVEQSRLAAA
jgi:hypothetical protein